jgi:hypothetical protein
MGSSSITQTDDVRVVVTAVHDTREMVSSCGMC